MSVTLAPRARSWVNASWPGVIEERDATALVPDLVGRDVLRDAAELAFGEPGLADRVEQGGLAVIDVAHDGHDRRALDRGHPVGALAGGLQFFLLLDLNFLFKGDDQGVEAHLFREFDRRFRLHDVVHGRHDAAVEQHLEQVLRLETHLLGQIPDLQAV